MNTVARIAAVVTQTLVVASICSLSQQARADLHDEMKGRWFVTEVIVFERSRVGLTHGGEPLLSEADWQWPQNMHLIRHASADGAVLDPDAYRERDTLTLLASDDVLEDDSTALSPVDDGGWRQELDDFETQLSLQGPIWLRDDALTMTSHRRDIERRLGASILFHGAWRQDVPGRETPYPVMLVEPSGSLFGTLSVTVNRFLHVSADLNFPVTGSAVIVDNTAQTEVSPGDELQAQPAPADIAQTATQLVSGVMRLQESRRVRSEELHYLDHPRFGVLLRIQEISFPDSLTTAWRQRSR
ncbi:MAG: peptidoglycan binding protein CsiV [Pseudomonadaceae bacterium]|nr:peptidoglycan binding protein CsiV [Pseudomonadaceae bacterium]